MDNRNTSLMPFSEVSLWLEFLLGQGHGASKTINSPNN